MQFKMSGSPRTLQRFYRLYFGFWIPVLVWASGWWPLSLMYWMARWLVIVPFALARPKYMQAVRGNYARILGLPSRHRDVRRVSWRMMFEHAYHWIDFFRWSQRSDDAVQANFARIEGWERYEQARRSGRGTLLLTAHMGNPEAGAVALGKHYESIHVLYWRDRFATAEEFRTKMRLKGNVFGIPVDASPLSAVPALRVLREGGLLAAHGDRDFNDQGWPVDFFGVPARFPPGPFMLAAHSHATVIPMFFLVEPDRRFHVVLEEPIDFSGEGDVDERVRAGLERWVRLLETYVRTYPEQWFCFYPFWGDGATTTARATTS